MNNEEKEEEGEKEPTYVIYKHRDVLRMENVPSVTVHILRKTNDVAVHVRHVNEEFINEVSKALNVQMHPGETDGNKSYTIKLDGQLTPITFWMAKPGDPTEPILKKKYT